MVLVKVLKECLKVGWDAFRWNGMPSDGMRCLQGDFVLSMVVLGVIVQTMIRLKLRFSAFAWKIKALKRSSFFWKASIGMYPSIKWKENLEMRFNKSCFWMSGVE